MPIPVTLHIYDVSTESTVRSINKVFSAVGTGAFHAAVEVLGAEWSFGYCPEGSGVFPCEPKKCEMHQYRESLPMGETQMSPAEVQRLISRLESEWPGKDYDLLRRNCCSFSDALCVELGVGHIPTWVTNLAAAGATLNDGAVAAGAAVTAAAVLAAAKAGEMDEKYKVSGTVKARAEDLLQNGMLLDQKYKVSETIRDRTVEAAAAIEKKAAELDAQYDISGKAKVAAQEGAAAASTAVARGASFLQGLLSKKK